MVRDEVKDSDMVRDSNWRIASETSDLAYILDSEGYGTTEIFDDRNSVK